MSETLFQIPSEMTNYASKPHRSLKVEFHTQENLSDDQVSKITALHEKTGWLTFSVEPIAADSLLDLPPLTFEKDAKSPSQRLQAVIFVRWTQAGKPMESFECYYRSVMAKIIDQFKEKLT